MREFGYNSGGEQLWASEAGDADAPVLVLLHPTPLGHHFWLPVVEQLRGWRCVVPDARAHGRSPQGDSDVLTIEQLGQDALALLDALGVRQAVFAGCSIGGYTLYEVWRRAPERVLALAFCSSKPHADTPGETDKRKQWISKMGERAGQSGPGDEFVEAMVGALTSPESRARREADLDELRTMMARMQPAAVAAVQRGLAARPDSRATAAGVTVPCCVIAGEADGSSTPAEMAELASLLGEGGARVEFHLLPQAGHYASWEQPQAVASLLQGFLDGLPGQA